MTGGAFDGADTVVVSPGQAQGRSSGRWITSTTSSTSTQKAYADSLENGLTTGPGAISDDQAACVASGFRNASANAAKVVVLSGKSAALVPPVQALRPLRLGAPRASLCSLCELGSEERALARADAAANGQAAPTEPGADPVERLLADLNDAQRKAVTHGEGPLLVLAGAGSGKTRVLVHRIAYLLATRRARAGEILAITFTNKAAEEMRERVERLVGRATRAMWVMTFHSACARIMRAEAERLGYSRGFTIYDEADSLRMVKRCMDELEIDPKRYPPRAIRSQISGAKNQLLDAAEFQGRQGSVFEQTTGEVYALYERRMLEANAMDFDDLLVRTVNVLELFEAARERWRRAFGQVLVDEYQDTNRAQYRLLQLLAEQHRNLFVVGDDAQCLVEGTLVTMGDGPSGQLRRAEGDEVISCYGRADIRPARVSGVYKGGSVTESQSRLRLDVGW